MSTKKHLTVEEALAAYKANPEGWLTVDLAGQRQAKAQPTFFHNIMINVPGRKPELFRFTWAKEQLSASVKDMKERGDNGVSIQFRRTSGALGEVLFRKDEFMGKFTADKLKKGELTKTLKNGKKVPIKSTKWFTTVQTGTEDGTVFEDPIIRAKCKFNADGTPRFALQRIKKVKGKAIPVMIRAKELDVHTYLKSRSETAGFMNCSTYCFSSQGVSAPTTVELILVKPAASMVPKAEDVFSADLLASMALDDDDDADDAADDAAVGDGDDETPDPTPPVKSEAETVAEGLGAEEALKAMAALAIA